MNNYHSGEYMHTVLGSGGSIGRELARELAAITTQIRLVSRNPKAINPTDQLYAADLTDFSTIDGAVAGSSVVYVTVGFDYNTAVWKKTWPPFMKAVVDACKKHSAKLVFFDNMYCYDPSDVPSMTESSRINPSSEKGKVRAEVVRLILDEVKAGTLTALIARAPDFYGPAIANSALFETVFKPLKAGKAAMWFSSADKIHQYIYTPDAARAVAILAQQNDTWNQTWHLPTDQVEWTGRQWTQAIAIELNVKPKLTVLPKMMVRLIGLFVPFLREMPEMMYQNAQDYRFKDDKFRKRFPDFRVTTASEGIRMVVSFQKAGE